jgi:hypothetical protein
LIRLPHGTGAVLEPLPPPRRMTMPCRWSEGGLGDFAGRVRFRRHFGYPGRIDAHERVWLTLARIEGVADITLNEHKLGRLDGGSGPFEFDVTALLQPRNDLVIEVDSLTGDGGLPGEVALEVRCTAYVKEIRIWVDGPNLHASGELVGVCERSLDLYLLLDRSTVAYTTLAATPEGRSFHLVSEPLVAEQQPPPHTVRVELVNSATIWFAWEGTI